jgi:hypothetical protein
MRIRAYLAAVALFTCAAAPALADDHPGKGSGKHDKGTKAYVDALFAERDRVVVREYYVTAIRGGHCPPGLAKKNNGCLPPGQAKKQWQVGRPLPHAVVFHELPGPLIVQLPPPPPRTRYVRVANDVLLIVLGTGMVLDAIEDLGRM